MIVKESLKILCWHQDSNPRPSNSCVRVEELGSNPGENNLGFIPYEVFRELERRESNPWWLDSNHGRCLCTMLPPMPPPPTYFLLLKTLFRFWEISVTYKHQSYLQIIPLTILPTIIQLCIHS